MSTEEKSDWLDRLDDYWPFIVLGVGLIYKLIMWIDQTAKQYNYENDMQNDQWYEETRN